MTGSRLTGSIGRSKGGATRPSARILRPLPSQANKAAFLSTHPSHQTSHRPACQNPERDQKKKRRSKKNRPETEFYRVRLPFRLSGGSPAPGPAGSTALVLIRLAEVGLCRVCSQLQSPVFSAVWPLCTPKVPTGQNSTAFSLPGCNQVLYMHLMVIFSVIEAFHVPKHPSQSKRWGTRVAHISFGPCAQTLFT